MATATEEPKVDATEQALEAQLLSVGKLMHNLSKDPKHRKDVLRLLKKADPSLPMPELDIESVADDAADAKVKPITEQLTGLLREVTDLKSSLARDRWKAAHGLEEEELVEVEQLAKDAGITKGETAIELWKSRHATLGTPRATRQRRGADEYLKKINSINPRNAKDLKNAAIAESQRILTEMSGRRMAG